MCWGPRTRHKNSVCCPETWWMINLSLWCSVCWSFLCYCPVHILLWKPQLMMFGFLMFWWSIYCADMVTYMKSRNSYIVLVLVSLVKIFRHFFSMLTCSKELKNHHCTLLKRNIHFVVATTESPYSNPKCQFFNILIYSWPVFPCIINYSYQLKKSVNKINCVFLKIPRGLKK